MTYNFYLCRTDGLDYIYIFLIYRLMHALFHIKIVIIPRDRYRPEGFSKL